MAKIQLFTEYTHTPRLDPNICPEKVIPHQGCMGYTCPVPNAQCSSTYHTYAQSATFRQIYIDMSTNTNPPKHWWQHMHYVALSRVTTLSGLYLKDLNEEKICISRNVANYIADTRKNAKLVLSYVALYIYRTEQLKIIYNNCRSYKKHYHDIQANYNMMAADIICIAET